METNTTLENQKFEFGKQTDLELINKALDRLKMADECLTKDNPNWSSTEPYFNRTHLH